MSLKDVAKYRAQLTGNPVQEELKGLRVRSEIKIEKAFGVDESNAYLKSEFIRKNNRLKGEE